jgi:hypothetical protein
MCKHKLYLWLEKCKFEKTRIEYLSVIISYNKMEMDLVKIAGVADWLTPAFTNDSSPGSLTMHAHSLT